MELRLTIVRPGSGHSPVDVDVRAGRHHSSTELAAALSEALGQGARHHDLRTGGAAVPEGTPVGSPPLLDGAALSLVEVGRAPGSPPRAPTRGAPVQLAVTGGPDAGHVHGIARGRHRIGRSPDIEVPVADDELSRVHAVVTVGDDGIRIADSGSTNGTWVDGVEVPAEGRRLEPGQLVAVGGSRLRVRSGASRPAAARPAGDGTIHVNRSPRVAPPDTPTAVRLPSRPPEPHRLRIPWIAMVAPLPISAVLAVAFGPQMLLFGLMSPVMMAANALGDRVGSARTHRADMERYAADLASTRRRVGQALAEEHARRSQAHPDAAEVLATATTPGSRLWERRQGAPDELTVRLGTGTVRSRVRLDDPAAGADPRHPVLHEAPICARLTEIGVLGLCGPRRESLGVARFVVGQLAVSHSPRDLTLWLVTPGPMSGWDWLVRLPHACTEVDGTRVRHHVDLGGGAEALTALEALVTDREAERERLGDRAVFSRHLVVIDGAHDARTRPAVALLLERGSDVGVHVLAIDDAASRLPSECRAVLHLTSGGTGQLEVDGEDACPGLVVDGVGPWWSERLSRGMAPLRDATPSGDSTQVPDRARLVDVLDLDPDDPQEVLRSWAASSGAPSAVVGSAADGPYAVDLASDGPHALVGGTTGSGKSEFLQTLVVSLALANRPEDLSFILVDYKGGSAFAECADLPHTVGLMTDLDPQLTERALDSLQAELRRRERLLHAVGAKDLDDYRRHGGDDREPLARLVLVIDEFRMLAEEMPDFLDGLIRIAAIGRSLGVHLVLATQRPGGVVSADVKANVNLRIALRVRDRVDSDDVIEAPDATRISERTPGRAIARSGGNRLVTFQSARVGGHAPSEEGEQLVVQLAGEASGVTGPTDPDEPTGPTDLERLVAAVVAAADVAGAEPPHRPWLPPLPEHLEVADLPTDAIAWGLRDEPAEQRQTPFSWDPADANHWAVVGAPGSGRTTALRTLAGQVARRIAPTDVHVYAVDGSGGLSGLDVLPHTGAVVHRDDVPRLTRLIARLAQEVGRRQAQLAERGLASVDEWHGAAGRDPVGDPPAYLLLLVDGWEQVQQATDAEDHGALTDQLLSLLRDGLSAGLRVVATGDRTLLFGRVAALFGRKLVLRLTDPGDGALVGLGRGALSEKQAPGRGLLVGDGSAVQVATLGTGAGGVAQVRELTTIGSSVVAAAGDLTEPDRLPFRLRSLPTEVALAELPAATGTLLLIGVGGDEVEPVGLDLDTHGRRLLVLGPPRSGRTTALTTLAEAAIACGHPVALVDGSHSGLADAAGLEGVVATFGPHDKDALVDARREHPDLVVVVDEGDRLLDTPVEPVLRELTGLVERDRGGVIVSATTATLAAQFRGIAVEVGRRQTGLLLSPQGIADGDVFGVRVSRSPQRVPGRGVLVRRGRATEVQVARSGAGARRT